MQCIVQLDSCTWWPWAEPRCAIMPSRDALKCHGQKLRIIDSQLCYPELRFGEYPRGTTTRVDEQQIYVMNELIDHS